MICVLVTAVFGVAGHMSLFFIVGGARLQKVVLKGVGTRGQGNCGIIAFIIERKQESESGGAKQEVHKRGGASLRQRAILEICILLSREEEAGGGSLLLLGRMGTCEGGVVEGGDGGSNQP